MTLTHFGSAPVDLTGMLQHTVKALKCRTAKMAGLFAFHAISLAQVYSMALAGAGCTAVGGDALLAWMCGATGSFACLALMKAKG